MIVTGLDIVRENLVLHLDTTNYNCFPRNGTTSIYNLVNMTEVGTLTNGATFSNTDGSITLNGTNNYIGLQNKGTPSCIIKLNTSIYDGYDSGGSTFLNIHVDNISPSLLVSFEIYNDWSLLAFYDEIVNQVNANTGTTGYTATYSAANANVELNCPANGVTIWMDYNNTNSIDYGAVDWILFNNVSGFYGFVPINTPSPDAGFNPYNLSQYSISTWIKNDNTTGGLITWYNSANSDYGFELEVFGGILYFAFSSGIYATVALPTSGQWVNISIVYYGGAIGNSNKLKLYINGQQANLSFTGTIPNTITANVDKLTIGLIRSGTGNRYLQGKFSHLLTYNSVLSYEDVVRNYDSTRAWFQ